MTPARALQEGTQQGARAGPENKIPSSQNSTSTRPVRDWIRHGPGLR